MNNITTTPIIGKRIMIYPTIYTNISEKVLPFYIRVTGIAQYGSNYEIKRINADHVRLAYVISGSGFVETEDKLFEVTGGDSYLLLKGTTHHYYTNPDDPWKMIWVNIYGDLANLLSKAYGLTQKHVFHCNIYDELSQILEILKTPEGDSTEITDNTCLLFHKILQKLHNSLPQKFNISDDTLIMKNYIDKNVDAKISIDKLGEIINRCPSHASRIFKQNMNITPYEYHLKNKIDKAILLLETTDIPIKEIAISLGFADEHYFSDIFKRKTGYKPSEFRKNK